MLLYGKGIVCLPKQTCSTLNSVSSSRFSICLFTAFYLLVPENTSSPRRQFILLLFCFRFGVIRTNSFKFGVVCRLLSNDRTNTPKCFSVHDDCDDDDADDDDDDDDSKGARDKAAEWLPNRRGINE